MNALTKPQIIEQNGKPAFAIVPWSDYQTLLIKSGQKVNADDVLIPKEVVKLNVIDNVPMVKAWRIHLRLTQSTVAKKLKMSQPGFRKIETIEHSKVSDSLKKVAKVLGVLPEQLIE